MSGSQKEQVPGKWLRGVSHEIISFEFASQNTLVKKQAAIVWPFFKKKLKTDYKIEKDLFGIRLN